YIERYFLGHLAKGEKEAFEKRCEDDPEFARDVSQYITMRAGLRQTLGEEKKEAFKKIYQNKPASRERFLKPWSAGIMRYASAAAAGLLIFLAWTLFIKKDSPKQLAEVYVMEEFAQLSATMSEGSDSLQQGIAFYNAKDYDKAEKIFHALSKRGPYAMEATKDLGLTFLVRGQYEKALEQFSVLSENKNLYANPGPFYKAVTLMRRSGPGDEEAAKLILKDVTERQLPGHKVASEWLRRW
ncbi:MAG TPA: tetratricopeptide repeat protein, partial [Chryseolinea sp.]